MITPTPLSSQYIPAFTRRHTRIGPISGAPADLGGGIGFSRGASLDNLWQAISARQAVAGLKATTINFELREGGVLAMLPARQSYFMKTVELDGLRKIELSLQDIRELCFDGRRSFSLPISIAREELGTSLRQAITTHGSNTRGDIEKDALLYLKLGNPNDRMKELLEERWEGSKEKPGAIFSSLCSAAESRGLSEEIYQLAVTTLGKKLFACGNDFYLTHDFCRLLSIVFHGKGDYGAIMSEIIDATCVELQQLSEEAGSRDKIRGLIHLVSKFIEEYPQIQDGQIERLCDSVLIGISQCGFYHESGMAVFGATELVRVLSINRDRNEAIFLKVIDKIYAMFLDALAKEPSEKCSRIIDNIQPLAELFIKLGDKQFLLGFSNYLVKALGIIYGKKVGEIAEPTEADYLEAEGIKDLPKQVASKIFNAIEKRPQAALPLVIVLIFLQKNEALCFRDTAAVQENISRMLYGPIAEAWQPIRAMIKAIPYSWRQIGVTLFEQFNEYSGDTGPTPENLRGISATVDKMGQEKGLMHAFRVQLHANASNNDIHSLGKILEYWLTGKDQDFNLDLEPGKSIALAMAEEIDQPELQKLLRGLPYQEKIDWYMVGEAELETVYAKFPDVSQNAKDKLRMTLQMYRMLVDKYGFHNSTIIDKLKSNTYNSDLLPFIDAYASRADSASCFALLTEVLKIRQGIKVKLLRPDEFNEEFYAASNQLYYKRHNPPDRVGVWGTYSEPRFDEFNRDRVLEAYQNVLIEELFAQHLPKMVERSALPQYLNAVEMLAKATVINGLATPNLLRLVVLAKTPTLSISQLRDVMAIITDECRTIIDNFNRQYRFNSSTDPRDMEREETFVGNMVADEMAFKRLGDLSQKLLDGLKTYLLKHGDSFAYDAHEIPIAAIDFIPMIGDAVDPSISVRYLLGSKAAHLFVMKKLGLNVPAGFAISQDMFKIERPSGLIYTHDLNPVFSRAQFEETIRKRVAQVEKESGKVLGGAEHPLILSVRSGGSISMPGMLETITNVGMNHVTTEALAQETGDKWFAYDCYRRFIQSYAMALFGMERSEFHQIIDGYKKAHGVKKKSELSGDDMEQIALAYLAAVRAKGFDIPSDPMEQVLESIKGVNRSWFSDRAIRYRNDIHISERWGTAIIIQEMVFGNLGDMSGTGVLFTHDPLTAKPGINGSFKKAAQGSDIVDGVGGSVLEIAQMSKINSSLFNALSGIGDKLIAHFGRAQDVEFTIVDGKVYALQTRALMFQERKFPAFENADVMEAIGSGSPIAGGAFSGRVVLDAAKLFNHKWDLSGKGPDELGLLYIKGDLTPEDLLLIRAAQGFVLQSGSATSHAAITLRALGKSGVVLPQMVIGNGWVNFGDLVVNEGEIVSFDGRTGHLWKGSAPFKRDADGNILLF